MALKETPYIRFFLVLWILDIVLTGVVFYARSKLPPVVPLWYGRPFGEAQLTDSKFLFLPLAVSFLVAVINYIVILLSKDAFIRKMLVGTSIVVFSLSLITVLKIILLVGNL